MNQPQQGVVVQSETNGLGLAGLIFSILGWLTCGLACIPGVFLSLAGMMSRGPKGTAIAGLIVGLPGVLFFIFVGLGLIMAAVSAGPAVKAAREAAERQKMEQPIDGDSTPSRNP